MKKKNIFCLLATMFLMVSCVIPEIIYSEDDLGAGSQIGLVGAKLLNSYCAGASIMPLQIVRVQITNNGNEKILVGNRSKLTLTADSLSLKYGNMDGDVFCSKHIRLSDVIDGKDLEASPTSENGFLRYFGMKPDSIVCEIPPKESREVNFQFMADDESNIVIRTFDKKRDDNHRLLLNMDIRGNDGKRMNCDMRLKPVKWKRVNKRGQ